MEKKRKKYTHEFKEEAVKLITDQGYQIAEAARNLGVNSNMLGLWKREIEGNCRGYLRFTRRGGYESRIAPSSERE